MKKLFIFLALFAGLLAAVVVALPFVLPMDMIHQKVITLVHDKTGGELQINGQTSFSLIPAPSISLNNVRFKTAPDKPSSTILAAKSIQAKIKLIPLLSKKIDVSAFIIHQPNIDFTVLKNPPPQTNHRQKSIKKPSDKTAPQNKPHFKPTITSEAQDAALPLSDISLQNVRIVNGTMRYSDQRTGKKELAEHINATVKLKDLDHPLSLKSDLVWHKKTVSLDADIHNPRILIGPSTSPLKITVRAPDIQFNFDGKVNLLKDLAVNGALNLQSGSVRQLMTWTGQTPPVPGGLGKLALDSNIIYTGSAIKLQKTNLELDKSKMNGHLTLYTTEAKPRITGELALNYLNLNSYLSKSKVYGWSALNGDDKLHGEYIIAKNTGRATARSANPSSTDTELDFQALNALNADLDLTLGGMRYQDIKLNQTRLHVKIKNAIMTANLKQMKLYQGHGSGIFTLNGKSRNSQMSSNFSLKNIAVLPLLKDAAKFEWVSGTGNIQLALKGSGSTVNNLKKKLNGTTDILFSDGAIEGVNIPAMLRNVTTGAIFGLAKNTAQKTDFSEMKAHFDIQKGVVHNDDLHLASPLLRISGKGKANLVTERLDYRIEPKIVASLEGQNSSKSASGINIPVTIKGSFSKPKIQPDVSKILENPTELINGAKDIGKTIKQLGKSKDIKNLLKGLF